MKTALRDLQPAGFDTVNQPMLAVDAARPESAQIAFQRFGFAQSGKRTALYIVDQAIDLVAYARIATHPMLIILPGAGRPDDFHRPILPDQFVRAAAARLDVARRPGEPHGVLWAR